MQAKENILITGGCGFVGTNLVSYLNRRGGCEITVLDNESLGTRAHLAGLDCRFVPGDILDLPLLREVMEGQNIVVHLAADTRVMDSIADPTHNFSNNVVGTFQVLETARHFQNLQVIIASTGGAILGEAPSPVHEDMLPRPMAPYGASKLAAEGYANAYSEAYGMDVACLRFSNLYGPRSFHKGSVVAHFFKQILASDPLIVYGDGSQIRDFLFVEDLMDGIRLTMDKKASGVFQLGSGNPTSIDQLLELTRETVAPRHDIEVRYEPFRAGEIHTTWCDISKAKRELGYLPSTPLADGLVSTWRWFVETGVIE